jgi:hypothetical protein
MAFQNAKMDAVGAVFHGWISEWLERLHLRKSMPDLGTAKRIAVQRGLYPFRCIRSIARVPCSRIVAPSHAQRDVARIRERNHRYEAKARSANKREGVVLDEVALVVFSYLRRCWEWHPGFG